MRLARSTDRLPGARTCTDNTNKYIYISSNVYYCSVSIFFFFFLVSLDWPSARLRPPIGLGGREKTRFPLLSAAATAADHAAAINQNGRISWERAIACGTINAATTAASVVDDLQIRLSHRIVNVRRYRMYNRTGPTRWATRFYFFFFWFSTNHSKDTIFSDF